MLGMGWDGAANAPFSTLFISQSSSGWKGNMGGRLWDRAGLAVNPCWGSNQLQPSHPGILGGAGSSQATSGTFLLMRGDSKGLQLH